MRKMGWGLALLALLVATSGEAQTNCRKTKAGVLSAGQPITIGAGATLVMNANPSRCSAMILNTSANGMICRDLDNDGAPTASAGIPVNPSQALTLLFEGQGRWQCIRSGAADATAVVVESLP